MARERKSGSGYSLETRLLIIAMTFKTPYVLSRIPLGLATTASTIKTNTATTTIASTTTITITITIIAITTATNESTNCLTN